MILDVYEFSIRYTIVEELCSRQVCKKKKKNTFKSLDFMPSKFSPKYMQIVDFLFSSEIDNINM